MNTNTHTRTLQIIQTCPDSLYVKGAVKVQHTHHILYIVLAGLRETGKGGKGKEKKQTNISWLQSQ